jgi:hypothetical protein
MEYLTQFIGWMLAILIGLFALYILYLVYWGKIKLTFLLSESTSANPTATASMARFQFLIFTFVIALSLFLVIVGSIGKCSEKGCPCFPDIPASILGLLGISGASYAVGKGIQASSDSSKGGGN